MSNNFLFLILEPHFHTAPIPRTRPFAAPPLFFPVNLNRRRTSRRQTESAEQRTRASYLRYVISGLAKALPTAGRSALLEAMRGRNAGRTTDAELAATVRALVDKHAVVLGLRYRPEHEVRPALCVLRSESRRSLQID
jgi:hypothetical protein